MEQQILDSVATRYREQGYETLVRPAKDVRPKFLENFEPDLIVRREQESIVVEIKDFGPKGHRTQLSALATEIARHPGWRLDVVVLKDAGSRLSATVDELQSRLEEGVRLTEEGHAIAGGLLIWSATEGAGRLAAAKLGVDTSPVGPASSLFRRLISEDYLDDYDLDIIDRVNHYRNSLSHGFSSVEDVGEIFKSIVPIAKRLIDASRNSDAA